MFVQYAVSLITRESGTHTMHLYSIAKSCLTPCNHVDCSPTCPSVHGIFQPRILEWVAISSSRGSSQLRASNWETHIYCGGDLVAKSCPVICDPWTVAHQVLCPENFPGKNIGVGSHSFLEGIFLA